VVTQQVKALGAEEISELYLRHTLYDWSAQADLKPLAVEADIASEAGAPFPLAEEDEPRRDAFFDAIAAEPADLSLVENWEGAGEVFLLGLGADALQRHPYRDRMPLGQASTGLRYGLGSFSNSAWHPAEQNQ